MNGKQAKRLRKRAREATIPLPELSYEGKKTIRLAECKRGAYRALKSGKYQHRIINDLAV